MIIEIKKCTSVIKRQKSSCYATFVDNLDVLILHNVHNVVILGYDIVQTTYMSAAWY